MATSTAADPAAIHKRSTELAISESTLTINPPYERTPTPRCAKYDAAMPETPVLDGFRLRRNRGMTKAQ